MTVDKGLSQVPGNVFADSQVPAIMALAYHLALVIHIIKKLHIRQLYIESFFVLSPEG
jgi:hypothetical protein